MANPNQNARSSYNGRYVRTPESAARTARAMDLRAKGWTYQQIADELGYADRATANRAITDGLTAIVREPGAAVLHFELERLDAELVRLDGLEANVRAVLDARHITVSNGRVIINPDTDEPMVDDGFVLQAVDRLLKIEDARRRNGERRAKLTGIEAAVKIDQTVHEVTQRDLELDELLREAKAQMKAAEQQILDGGTDD